MSIDELQSHICTPREVLAYLKAHPSKWTARVRRQVETAIRETQNGTEEELQRMIDEDLFSDVELFMVEFTTMVDGSSDAYLGGAMCIPLSATEPNAADIWKGSFAFLVQGAGLYAIVKEVVVVTISDCDEYAKIGEARHIYQILNGGR